jgi:hypothetical protein
MGAYPLKELRLTLDHHVLMPAWLDRQYTRLRDWLSRAPPREAGLRYMFGTGHERMMAHAAGMGALSQGSWSPERASRP